MSSFRTTRYTRNGGCLFKPSDKNDPKLQALKRKNSTNYADSNKKAHSASNQRSINTFIPKMTIKRTKKSRSTTKKENNDNHIEFSDIDIKLSDDDEIEDTKIEHGKSDETYIDSSNDDDDDDVNIIPNPNKTDKKKKKHKKLQNTKRPKLSKKPNISDDDSIVKIAENYAELKPLESFVSKSASNEDSKTNKLLIESAHVESTGDLTLSSEKVPKLFKPVKTSKDIERIRIETQRKHKIPPPMYSSDLFTICKPLLGIVKYILKGTISSSYYMEAKNLSKQSHKPFFSLHDVPMSALNRFMAGFYGWKRQTLVGEFIFTEYKMELSKNKSPVVKWWGAKDFATYVLAPEVLAFATILQMKTGKGSVRNHLQHNLNELTSDDIEDLQEYALDVRDIFDATMEYGYSVVDNDPLEPWEGKLSNDISSSSESSDTN
ncbi:restriction of telomere capping protein 4 [Monosporozyma unispora]|nr:Restriction of telomere capping protein 4 [Kazachstania unispora]